jgi:type II secretion system (T2SS) protein M
VTVGKLDRRTLLTLVTGVAVILALRFGVYGDKTADVVAPTDSIPVAEQRLERLRQVAATVPGRETVLKQVTAELNTREKGMIQADTAAQAQAQLLEVIRRIAGANGIDARGAEELRVRPLANDYGEVLVAVTFNCAIEQLVNFLAALANEPEVLATNEIHITSGNAKQKTIQVRLSLSAVVPKKLVPEKKGVAAF